MKKNLREKGKKAGSALLVVLGFLSFMVVSAVAFAIYMRAERLPSSALRRNVATRHLVKAALAQAMSRVDDAIRNDPFPGLCNTNGGTTDHCYHDVTDAKNPMDVWYGRVFMPPDPDGSTDWLANPNEGYAPSQFAPITETVSVLNLEALGYLPPPLVNDVRFLSRSTWTAKWQNFAYDAGRFAFCAVNVSDYFDINRTKVGVRSSPLDSCISLLGTLSLSRKWGHDQDKADKPEESFVLKQPSDGDVSALTQLLGPTASRPTKNSKADPTTEYVSMLDYNLALGTEKGKDGVGDVCNSPFYKYLSSKGENHFYYNSTFTSGGNDGLNKAMRQPFVTDSFFPASNMVNGAAYEIDYSKLAGHPFNPVDMSNGKKLTLQDMVIKNADKFLKRMYDKGVIGPWDIPVFYDYLDHDDVPISLAMPGVECVPMITAVELVGNNLAQLKVNQAAPVVQNPPQGQGVQTTTMTYELDQTSFDSNVAGVRVLVAFPFRHFAGRNLNGYNVQVAMKVFVSSDGPGGNGIVSVRPQNDLLNLRPQNKTEWNQPCQTFTIDGKTTDALAWSLYSDKVAVTIPNTCDTQEDALKTGQGTMMYIDVKNWNGAAKVPGGQAFFSTITEQPGTMSATGVFTPSGQATYSHEFNLRPFKDGTLMQAGKISGDISDAPYANDQFKVYAMVWVRITDSNGNETYDLAPAVVADDELNGKTAGQGSPHAVVYEQLCEFGPQVSSACLRFSDQTTHYTYNTFSAKAAVPPAAPYPGLDGASRTWTPNALATVDPRYNYAPEDWFEWNDSNIDGAKWLTAIASAGYFDVTQNRDPDIFMFTSNQGYLQSLGEFAFLPRLSQWQSPPSGRCPRLFQPALGASATATHASSPNNILNNVCAWRTYPADSNFYEDCASIGIGRDSSKIQTVNPYSDDNAVLMAAFANTPCDYWTTGRIVAGASSRGETLDPDFEAIVEKLGDKNNTSGEPIDKLDECLKFSFCNKNADDAKMEDADMVRNMLEVSKGFRVLELGEDGNSVKSWEETYDTLFENQLAILNGAGDYKTTDINAETFMGATLNNCPLYSIDRKFLYSYWRECFANKQQLFLIFVRAESTALGGPGEGTPAQQGGRAVALVWREPQSNQTNGGQNGAADDIKRTYAETNGRRRPHRMRVLFYHQFD